MGLGFGVGVSLAEVLRAAHERDLEVALVDVVRLVRRSQHLVINVRVSVRVRVRVRVSPPRSGGEGEGDGSGPGFGSG